MAHVEQDGPSTEGLEVQSPSGWKAKAKGRDTPLWLLIVALVGAIAVGGWKAVEKTSTEHTEIKRGFDEVSYLLSIPQAEREKLNLREPDSLRRKRRREE